MHLSSQILSQQIKQIHFALGHIVKEKNKLETINQRSSDELNLMTVTKKKYFVNFLQYPPILLLGV